MRQEILASAIHALQELLYNKEHKSQFLAMKTLEMYMNLNLFQDVKLAANEIEKQHAFSLLAPMKLYDMTTAQQIEQQLLGL
ncbi:hypothetical protein KFD70_06795 [Bacillus pfraonensis]|uniref:hypothetical protein n=1 Tax=Bacillus TaxID=1386 RepID=UPI003012A666